MNNDPYDDLPLGMIDEEFFEEIAIKPREPTNDEIRDMWILSAQEHPELFGETFFKKELSTLEELSTHIAESSLYTNAKPCDIMASNQDNKEQTK